jgi:RNA-binding protein
MDKKLKSNQRQYLKQLAHKKKPVVMIGDKGVTENVINEINGALLAHELIKVKVKEIDREQRAELINQIMSKVSCHLVQKIGQIVVLYRAQEEGKQKITLP